MVESMSDRRGYQPITVEDDHNRATVSVILVVVAIVIIAVIGFTVYLIVAAIQSPTLGALPIYPGP